MRLIAAAFILAAALPVAALADTQQQQGQQTAVPAQQESEARENKERGQLICRRLGTTGSRTKGQRVCLTQEEWRKVKL